MKLLAELGQSLSKQLLRDPEADGRHFADVAECLLQNVEIAARHYPDRAGEYFDKIGAKWDIV
jgi:hypothetical protein